MAQTKYGEVPVIELINVDKHFGDLHVLKNINLSVHRGEVVVIIGPSGSGKSTLCRTMNRLETIDSGEIRIEGTPIPQEGRELARLRAQVGMVFQQFNLFAHKTILDNVTLGPMDVLKKSKKEAREEAMRLLTRVGVESQAAKVPAQLSGGQQQRVAIARALAMHPKAILFDEPTSNLSVQAIDRLPLSKEQEVRVIMESASENPHFDEETGRLTWDVTIDAGAQKSIEYAYRVSYPKGKTISYEEDGHTW